MGLLDKLTGSRPGQPGIAPVPAAELLQRHDRPAAGRGQLVLAFRTLR